MAVKEAASIVDKGLLVYIRQTYPNPVLALFDIGQEGESKGAIDFNSAEGNGPWYKQLWSTTGIESLVKRVSEKNEDIFIGHAENESAARTIVGNVIASKSEPKNNILHALAVGHITDEATQAKLKSGELDCCSIEARCVFEEIQQGDNTYWKVAEVKDFQGLALGNSEETAPGFEGATVIGVLAALSVENDRYEKKKEGKVINMDLQELITGIRAGGYSPEQIFSSDQLLKCSVIKGAIEAEVTERTKETEKKLEELKIELVPFHKHQAGERVKNLISEAAVLANESKKTVEYLQGVIHIDITNKTDAEGKALVETEIKSVMEHMKNFGIAIGDKDKDKDKDKNKDADNETDKDKDKDKDVDKDKDSDNLNDYTDPKNNPLIPGSTAS